MCGGRINDNFLSARLITGTSGQVLDSNLGANQRIGRTAPRGSCWRRSVWYRWQAPASVPVIFSTHGSDFDTLMAIYTGAAVNGLTLVAANDDSANSNNLGRILTSNVMINAVSGTTYYIAVDGARGLTGHIALGWGQQASISGLEPT
jgi:hypothetical protein